MDVRCDRCQTEYELDDSSVSEIGTEVECGDCGHTFKIKRTKSSDDLPQSPPAAEWLLETKAGQSHRFRDLTLLQKWIIERKVTRDDKISRSGQAWRRLGEIIELAPFFDVVDEADKAKATAASSASNLPQQSMPSPAPVSPIPSMSAQMAMPSPSPQSTLGGINMPAFPPAPAGYTTGAYPMPTDRTDTTLIAVVPSKYKGLLKLLITAGVATGVAYLGIAWIQSRNPQAAAISSLQPIPPIEHAQPRSITVIPVAPLPTTSPVVATLDEPPESLLEPPAPTRTKKGKARARVSASPYVRLVAEGDHFRVRAASNKARQRYERALALKPDGGEALVGLGRVALSHRQHSSALVYFKRALKSNPSMGSALFGVAEAYRLGKQKAAAMQAYRRYLQTLPQGSDAPAALKHLKALDHATR